MKYVLTIGVFKDLELQEFAPKVGMERFKKTFDRTFIPVVSQELDEVEVSKKLPILFNCPSPRKLKERWLSTDKKPLTFLLDTYCGFRITKSE